MSPHQINKCLLTCKNVTDMLGLHELHRASFDDVNIATCWVVLRRTSRADPDLLCGHRDLLAGLREHTLASASTLSPRAVANIVHSLAAIEVSGREWTSLWARLERVCIERSRGMRPLEIALTVSAFAQLGRPAPNLFQVIAALAAPQLKNFRAFDLSMLAGCFVGAGHPDPALLDAVASEATLRVHELKPVDVGALASSFAKTDRAEPKLFMALARHALRILHAQPTDFSTAALAQTAWAFARAEHPALMDAIAVQAAVRLAECSAVEVSRLAWAMATAHRPAPEFFGALSRLEPRQLALFGPQSLANTAWAVASAGQDAPALFDAIAEQATPRLQGFSCEGLSILAHAFAKAEHAAPALFDALAPLALRRLHTFKGVDLSTIAWAFAAASHPAPELFYAISGQVQRRIPALSSHAVANIAWAFAKAGHASPSLFRKLARWTIDQPHAFEPQGLSNIAWAFATVRVRDPALFTAIAQAMIEQAAHSTTQGLSNTAWAFAMVGSLGERPDLVEALCEQAASRLSTFCPDDLSMIAWACAVADTLPHQSNLFGPSFGRRCDELAPIFCASSLSRLHQWRLWYSGERGQVAGLPSASLQDRCARAFSEQMVQSSKMQDDVGAALASVQLAADSEVLTAEGYRLDFVVRFRGATFALEVDGPDHFVGTYQDIVHKRDRRFASGSTILKHRQIRHFGWRLIVMTHWNWQDLKRGDQDGPQRRRAISLWLAMALAQQGDVRSGCGAQGHGAQPGGDAGGEKDPAARNSPTPLDTQQCVRSPTPTLIIPPLSPHPPDR